VGLEAAGSDLLELLRQFDGAVSVLGNEISPEMSEVLRRTAKTLEAEWVERLESYRQGRFPAEPSLDPATGQGLNNRESFAALARKALPSQHPLFALVQFGQGLALAKARG
jgi:hypothetical protein